jgi:hypothetical protein
MQYPRTIKGISFWTAVVMVLLTALSGCGLKTDPVLPDLVLPKAVSQLHAERTKLGISITWTKPAEVPEVTGFRIARSEIETAGGDCPGCPRDYVLLADLSPGARELTREGGGTYRYGDFTVRPGRLYSYRIAACYGSGMCSEALESAEIKYD